MISDEHRGLIVIRIWRQREGLGGRIVAKLDVMDPGPPHSEVFVGVEEIELAVAQWLRAFEGRDVAATEP